MAKVISALGVLISLAAIAYSVFQYNGRLWWVGVIFFFIFLVITVS